MHLLPNKLIHKVVKSNQLKITNPHEATSCFKDTLRAKKAGLFVRLTAAVASCSG